MVLIYGAVLGLGAGVLAGLVTGAGLVAFWLVMPLIMRIRAGPPERENAED